MTPRKQVALEDKESAPLPISPEDYAAFIQQVELDDVWLVSAHIENRHGPTMPKDCAIATHEESRYQNHEGGFDSFVKYRLSFGNAEEPEVSGCVEVQFGLRFTSQQPMNDPIFAIFSDVNLPVNAWPFLREFLHTATARMGWPVLTLPTFKAGTSPPAKPSPPRRRSRSASTLPRSP